MKYYAILISAIIAVAATVLLFGAEAEIGEKAPDFTLQDSKGNTHSLSDFEGKYVVLEWINFGCPFVKKHYNSENMQELQKKYTDMDVVWLAICSSAPGNQGYMEADQINEKIEDYEAAMTAYLIDEDGEVGKDYGAKTTPHMFIIDPDGKLVYAGGIDDIPSTDQNDIDKATNYVDQALTELFNGQTVSKETSKPYGCSVKYAK